MLPALAVCLVATAGDAAPVPTTTSSVSRQAAPGVLLVGLIAHPNLTESSGLVASRQHPGVLWTHNDGGGPKRQVLHAITREGRVLAEFHVTGAALLDWEDIAIDDHGHLFIGDLGNNESRRDRLAVHEVDEPDPKAAGFVRVKRAWQLRYPGRPFDCESLFVWQSHGYIVSKVLNDARAEIYRFPLADAKEPLTLEFVARLKIDSPVTGADVSADGRWLGLVAKNGAYVYRIDGDMARAAELKPHHTRFKHEHVEGCAFVPEGLLATAESREIYLFNDAPFQPGK
jgi:hypothetical protein